MDLSLIFNDPAHQQIASMMGMDMQAYVANMDPRAVQANIANLSRGPAVYNTQEQVDNLNSVGANSGANAYTPEQGSPVTAGALSIPVQPTQPNVGVGVLNTPSYNSPVQRGGTPAALSQPGQGGMLPEHGGGISEPFVPQYPGDVPDHVRNAQNSAPPTVNPHPDAVLTSGGTAAVPGALTSGGTATSTPRPNAGPSSGARQTPTNNTGNARRSGMPDMRIGRMEQLGRMGSAMLGASGDGLNAAMSAGGNAMYAVNDENRAAQMTEYENSERLRLEEAQRRATAASGGSGSGADPLAASTAIKLRDVDAALQGLDDYDGVVGMGYWFNVGWDKITDSQRATIRQKIARVKVDATLSNTALTKGAISDKEMQIFQSDQPAWTDGENAWRTWLSEYRGALMIMNSNLASGATPYLNQGASGGQPTGSAPAFNAADYTIEEMP